MAESERLDRAIELVENITSKFHSNDVLITFLYGLYCLDKNPLKANDLLKDYKKELKNRGYSEDEIDQYISDVITDYEGSPT